MKLTDAIFGLAAVIGVLVFVVFYDAAFPAAAIDLELSRAEIRERAEAYVRDRGIEPDTFRSALTFEADGGAAVFLQRVRGLEATSRFAREQLALWNWRIRWFRSGERDEYRIRLTPDGGPLRFQRLIPEAAAGDSLSQDSARTVAARFVRAELGLDLGEWRLEDQSTEVRDNRVDHTFTWKRRGSEIEWRPEDPEAGTASIELRVEVQGSEIGGFARYLDVPEKFQREQSKATSVGQLLSLISLGLMGILVIVAVVLAIRRYKDDRIRWRPGLVVGGIVGVVVLLSGLLGFPLIKAGYPTEMEFSTFVAITVIGSVLAALVLGLAIAVTAAAGESLGEETFPGGLNAFRDWAAGHLFTGAAGREVLRGYAVGLAFLGYITLFYLIGRRYVGVWLPAEGPHSQLLGMYLPWLVPLLVALQASLSEEFLLRLFGVSLVKRYLKVTFLALLIPAMIWAFGHSTYPVFPVYVRGIELTIAGLVFGWIFIRYGLVTMLVAHFAIDAILLAMPFLRASGGSYVGYGVAALLIAALPLIVPILSARRRRSEPARP